MSQYEISASDEILFIFVTALVGTYIQRRNRDLCLKDFAGFNVTVE